MKNTLTKIEVLHDAEKYFGLARITNIALQNYIKKGLIKRIDHFHKKGVQGSVALYPKNTPGKLYLIRMMQNRGLKLKEIGGYLSLFNLDFSAIRDIKELIEEDTIQKKEMLFLKGITPETRELMLKKIPLKLLKLRKLEITRLEKFKKIIELRAYSELDHKEVVEIIIENSKDQKTFNKIQNTLDSPTIHLDIEDSQIRVSYKKPFNKTILFSTNNKSEVINI